VASQRPLPLPDTSTRNPSHASAAMTTVPNDSRLGDRPASPLTGAAPRLPSLTPSSSIPAPSSSSTDTAKAPNLPTSSVLTPAGAVSDGFSPSGPHGGNPHSSQVGGHPLFFSHMTGSWPAPGLSQPSAYSYSNSNSNSGAAGSGPLAQPSYSRNPGSYGQASSPSHQHFPGRASSSAPSGDTIPAPQSSYQDQQGFPSPVGVGGAGAGAGGNLGSPLSGPGSQQSGLAQPLLGNATANPTRQIGPGQNTTGGGSAAAQDGSSYRPQPTPTNYYPHTSAPQQPSFPSYASTVTQPSPTTPSPATTSGSIPRVSASIPALAPPLQYPGGRVSSMASYASYSPIPGPVLSNMHHPGAPLSMVSSMSGLSSYSHHTGLSPHHPHHVYLHPGGPSPQSERPFKCNTCPQAFNRNHDLKRHQRIHLAVKPFGCEDCDKRFSRKDALKVG
jgi:hypothetical protein